ncbi:MAG: hypothetical protein AAF567_24560 [Actinomycetota bacterium]
MRPDELSRQIRTGHATRPTLRLAKVKSVSIVERTIDFGDHQGIPYLDSYAPHVGDTILWTIEQARVIVLGRLLTGRDPSFLNGTHTRTVTGVETVPFYGDFDQAPTTVIVTASAGTPVVTNKTTAGFDVDVLDHAGASVLGQIDWAAWR